MSASLLDERQRVVIVSLQARRLCEVFGDEALLGRNNVVLVSPQTDLPEAPEPGTLTVVHGRFPEGWHSRTMALTVFTDAEVFGWARATATTSAAARHARRRSWRSCGPATSSCIRSTASGASMGWSSWPAAASSASTC